MLRETAIGDKYWLAVTSKGRPFRVAPLTEIAGDATWYVPEGEKPAYDAAGAVSVRECHPVTGRGPAGGRNLAMEDAFERDIPVFVLDDDIRWFKLCYPKLGSKYANTRLHAPIQHWMTVFASRANAVPEARLFFPAINNDRFASNQMVVNAPSSGGVALYIKPTNLRMASFEELRYGEDTDYGYQHLREHGAYVKYYDLTISADNYSWQRFKGRGSLPGGLSGEYISDPSIYSDAEKVIRRRNPELPSFRMEETRFFSHRVRPSEVYALGGQIGQDLRRKIGGAIPLAQLREELSLLPPEYMEKVKIANGGAMF